MQASNLTFIIHNPEVYGTCTAFALVKVNIVNIYTYLTVLGLQTLL